MGTHSEVGIVIAGKAGNGKSALRRALVSAGLRTAFGELDVEQETLLGVNQLGDLRAESERIVVLLTVAATDRALHSETRFLAEQCGDAPVLVAATQIDLMRPIREWEPEDFSRVEAQSEKGKNLQSWSRYLAETTGVERVHLTSVETPDGTNYGVEDLLDSIEIVLCDAAPWPSGRLETDGSFDTELGGPGRRTKARAIIATASIACSSAGMVVGAPGAIASALASQSAMLMALSRLYQVDSVNIRLVARLVACLAADLAAQGLVRSRWGRPAAAASAGVMTAAAGETYLEFLETGDVPNPEAFAAAVVRRLHRRSM